MKILVCGDVVGRSGRDAVCGLLPALREALALDFVVVNGENAAHGFGITDKICAQLYEAGTDVITTGNHVWDQREVIAYIGNDKRLLRPANFPPGTPGRGWGVYETRRGKRVLVMNVMCRLFMDALDDPFRSVEEVLGSHRLGANVDAIVIDVHGEATSEKMALGFVADGRASLVAGTHTHVPTADAQVLAAGTGYISDLGMCGDYDSVIGLRKDLAIERFRRKMPGERLVPADGPGTLCAVYVETDDKSGLARHVAPLRLGPRLAPAWPLEGGVTAAITARIPT
ncbi:MAG: YmdB family metallophosphoesterase [Alphaproteobacteria bacterium]|nr:YmdB family metallophosphoesterase [Alphaproteobacteria bacterium]